MKKVGSRRQQGDGGIGASERSGSSLLCVCVYVVWVIAECVTVTGPGTYHASDSEDENTLHAQGKGGRGEAECTHWPTRLPSGLLADSTIAESSPMLRVKCASRSPCVQRYARSVTRIVLLGGMPTPRPVPKIHRERWPRHGQPAADASVNTQAIPCQRGEPCFDVEANLRVLATAPGPQKKVTNKRERRRRRKKGWYPSP